MTVAPGVTAGGINAHFLVTLPVVSDGFKIFFKCVFFSVEAKLLYSQKTVYHVDNGKYLVSVIAVSSTALGVVLLFIKTVTKRG